jgi:excisionase family DNA binding protein
MFKLFSLPCYARAFYHFAMDTQIGVDTINERLTVSVREAAAMLGLSKNSVLAAVERGELPAIRVGRRILIARLPLERRLGARDDGAGTGE